MSTLDETPRDEPAPPLPEPAARHDRLKAHIAISLAVLVVLGAGIAILQVQASSNESNTARQTTRVAVEAMRANVVASTVAGLSQQLGAERAFLPFRRPLAPNGPSLAEAAGATSSTGPAGSLRVARQAVPDLGVGTLLPRLQTDGERLTLKQRALARTRVTWNTRSTQYTTVIAVLAVAIFLVGFGLVVGGPIRGSAYVAGAAVGLFAAGWAAWLYFLPIPTTPDRAIDAAARGAVRSANGDYRAAIASYDDAIEAKDDFAAAYSGRSRARLLAANPDYPVTRAVTDLGGETLAAALRDARTAHELDGRDILATSLLALTSFYRGDYEQARSAADAAIAINGNVPDLWLLSSAIDVALGDRVAATAALAHGLDLLRGAAPSQQTRLLASTYLSYMAWVERHAPARAEAARALASRIVSVETAFTLDRTLPKRRPATGTISISGLRFSDGKLTLHLRWAGLPAGTALTAIAYERPRPNGAWTQPPDLALFATAAGSGERDITVPLERACDPTGVRVDVYANGKPALSRTGPGVRATC